MKISLVGGGSPIWTKTLVKDILLVPALADATFFLIDPNREAADLNATFLRKLAAKFKVGARFVVSEAPESLEGSDYIIITVSTGGFHAMQFDLSVPEQFNVFHTVGDTSGPGGWARLIRNFKPFVALAATIRRLAPHAVVMNYTNPMSTLTDVLTRLLDNPVIGLCHGLFENLELIKRHYKLESEGEISINYGGLNHFFWCDQLKVRGVDVIREFRDSGKSLTQILQASYTDGAGFESTREVASELFGLTGILPYLGDRHTCEFFPWYITDPARIKAYRLKRTTIAQRRKMHRKAHKDLLAMVAGKIPKSYTERSRETAADIIEAHHLGKTFIDVGNVPNVGQISNLPLGTIVETAVRIDQNGVSPICYGPLPETVAPFVRPYAEVYKLTVDACFEGNRHTALQALRLDPVCANISTPDVLTLGNHLIDAHRRWIDCF